jgi:hypothetical protein
MRSVPITRTTRSGCNVDAGICDTVDAVNDLGLDTITSCSGLRADHPDEPQYRVTSGYLGIVTRDAAVQRAIRAAAAAAGLTADSDGETAFYLPGVTVRVPRTAAGDAHESVTEEGNRRLMERHGVRLKSLSGTDEFLQWLRVRDGIIAEYEAERGGINDAPDEAIRAMWTRFVEELQAAGVQSKTAHSA